MFDLAHARALCDAATPGPWIPMHDDAGSRIDSAGGVHIASSSYRDNPRDEDDVVFLCAARTGLPRALDEIEYQRKLLSESRSELANLGEQLSTSKRQAAQLRTELEQAVTTKRELLRRAWEHGRFEATSDGSFEAFYAEASR